MHRSFASQFTDIFAKHRFEIGINNDFKVKLTPIDDRAAYSQSVPAPLNLKGDILVELALLHKYGIITTLAFSKYASPIFAQRKPNGKLRLFVGLKKIYNLKSDDYINNNHPVSTLVDAAQHIWVISFSLYGTYMVERKHLPIQFPNCLRRLLK